MSEQSIFLEGEPSNQLLRYLFILSYLFSKLKLGLAIVETALTSSTPIGLWWWYTSSGTCIGWKYIIRQSIMYDCYNHKNLSVLCWLQAASDACQLMGHRKFYDQMIIDACQHEKYKITDEVDVTTMQDYMQVPFCINRQLYIYTVLFGWFCIA